MSKFLKVMKNINGSKYNIENKKEMNCVVVLKQWVYLTI